MNPLFKHSTIAAFVDFPLVCQALDTAREGADFSSAGIALISPAKTTSSEFFSNWPKGAALAEVGKRVAENFLTRKFRYETIPDKVTLGMIYPEVIAWYGALTLAQLTNDQDLSA